MHFGSYSPISKTSSLAIAGLSAFSLGLTMSLSQALPCEKPEEIVIDLNGPQKDFGVVVTEHIIQEGELEKPIPDFAVCAKARAVDGQVPVVVDGNKGELVEAERRGIRPVKMAIPTPINPAFDTNLYQLLKQGDGNVFFSPYSITECLGMVYAGTGKNTAAEIGKAMSFGKDAKLTSVELKKLRTHLSQSLNRSDCKLNIANALCVTGITPKQGYQNIVRDEFGGEIFSGGLAEINGWASKKTEGKIKEILKQLSPDSACVLLNAVYFKGDWKYAFKANDTHKANFHLTNNDKVKVDMMKQKGGFKVLRGNGMTIVELPYKNSASMVLMLPDQADGMAALEKKLNDGLLLDLGQRLSQSQPERIELHLPKFKIEAKCDLVGAMKSLGMKEAFEGDGADFSVMYDRSDVKITQIKHKAILEVDEKGSVAAAVTAVGYGLTSSRPTVQLPKIRFDRPFITIIRDRETGANLFMGRINDPTK